MFFILKITSEEKERSFKYLYSYVAVIIVFVHVSSHTPRQNKLLMFSPTHFLSERDTNSSPKEFCYLKSNHRASLVAKWLRIRLPVQGTRVRALVREDPTCHRATKPVHHNYWARVPQLLKPMHLEPMLRNKRATAMRSPHTATKSSPRSPQLEKARTQQRRPNTVKIKIRLELISLICFGAFKAGNAFKSFSVCNLNAGKEFLNLSEC